MERAIFRKCMTIQALTISDASFLTSNRLGGQPGTRHNENSYRFLPTSFRPKARGLGICDGAGNLHLQYSQAFTKRWLHPMSEQAVVGIACSPRGITPSPRPGNPSADRASCCVPFGASRSRQRSSWRDKQHFRSRDPYFSPRIRTPGHHPNQSFHPIPQDTKIPGG